MDGVGLTKASKKSRKIRKAEAGQTPLINMIEVDNPEYSREHHGASANPKRITAAINMRESPLVWYISHGDVTASQGRAGTWVRRLHELAGGAGVQAMDYTREPVDGGRVTDGLTDIKATAAKRLSEARDELERTGCDWRIVEQVCAWGYFVKQLTQTRRENSAAMQRLCASLGVLAIFWGYESLPAQRNRKTG